MSFKKFYIAFLFLCAVLIGAGFGFREIYLDAQKGRIVTWEKNDAIKPVSNELLQYLEHSRATSLELSGSISFDEGILLNCYDAAWKQFHCSDMLSPVASYLSGQGCLVGPVNGTFAGEGKGRRSNSYFDYSGQQYKNAPDEFAKMLSSSQFTMLAMAGQHAFDSNYTGLCNTYHTIKKYQMKPVGIFPERNDLCDVETVDLGGVTAGIYSYTERTNAPLGSNNEYTVHTIKDEDELTALCKSIEKNSHLGVDISVVMLSFQKVSDRGVTTHQKQLASRLFDAGADIVVGTNDTVIQPMEIRKTKTKQKKTRYQIALYSLGNLITAKRGSTGGVSKNTSLLARFSYASDSTGFYLNDVAFSPTYCVSYPTTASNEDAGDHVRVFSISDVMDYVEQGGLQKSQVKVTGAKPKNSDSVQQTTETSSSVSTEQSTTEETSEEKEPVTTEAQQMTEQAATEAMVTTEAPVQTSEEPMVSRREKKWFHLFERVAAKEDKTEEDYVEEEYVTNLTSQDFTMIARDFEQAVKRLFSACDETYTYRDGWFYLKK